MSRAKPLPVVLFMGVSQTLGASWALAQETAPPSSPSSSEPVLEEVVVTGSRIRQSGQNFANPVTSFTADAIAQSGKTDLADYLAQSPALVGSVTGSSSCTFHACASIISLLAHARISPGGTP